MPEKIIILNNMEFEFDFVLSVFLTSLNILFYVLFLDQRVWKISFCGWGESTADAGIFGCF